LHAPSLVVGPQAGGQALVARRIGVPDRLDLITMVGVPLRGGAVQLRKLTWLTSSQLQLQQVGEQLVVAEPGSPHVNGGHERIGLLQLLQDPLPAGVAGQQVCQLPVHLLQHGSAAQEPPHRVALPVEHFGQQVLGDSGLTAGEVRDEPLRIRVPGQRERGEPQPGRPALGAVKQQREGRVGYLDSSQVKQCPCFLEGKPEVGGPDIGHRAFEPQPMKPQPQVTAGGEHEPQLSGGTRQEQLQLALRFL
jgi:hypothetical protein